MVALAMAVVVVVAAVGRNGGSGGAVGRGQRAIVDSFIVVLIDCLECYKFGPFSIFLSMIDIMNQK